MPVLFLSKPTSKSALISSGLSVTLTVKVSSYLSKSVCSMLMYISVFRSSL